MKCKLTKMWHHSPEECQCVDQLHLNLNNKYCICFYNKPDNVNNYCGDTWKIVNQEAAKKLLIGNSHVFQQLKEWFEYV